LNNQANTVYLALGSNLGDKQGNITSAINRLKELSGVEVVGHSSVYLTPPVGVSRQPDFYNCAVEIKCESSPHELLKQVKSIELDMGREPGSHFQPRPIDIDILLYGDFEIDTLELLIPHSRLPKRAFVLAPLLELKPDLIHPTTFKPLKEYLEELGDTQKVEKAIDARELFDE